MSITKFIVQNIVTEKDKEVIQTNNVCMICWGSETNNREFIYKKKMLSANFNDINEFERKDNDMICWYCQFCLEWHAMDSPKGKRCGLRLYSFYADKDNFEIIDRSKREYFLFEKKYKWDFVLAFSETWQKHISFKSVYSNDTNTFNVCTDTRGTILFERNKWDVIYKRAKELYEFWLPKKSLLWDIDPRWMKKLWLTFKDITTIKANSNNMAYELIINSLYHKKKEAWKKKG